MPYKPLSKENKEMFLREIEEMNIGILKKNEEIMKLSANRLRISKSITYSIQQQKNAILAAEVAIEELEFDLKNEISFKEMGQKIDQATREIKRLENNIKVRTEQIE